MPRMHRAAWGSGLPTVCTIAASPFRLAYAPGPTWAATSISPCSPAVSRLPLQLPERQPRSSDCPRTCPAPLCPRSYVGGAAPTSISPNSSPRTPLPRSYVGGSYYARNEGKSWIQTMLLTAGIFPVSCFAIAFVLNTIAIFYQARACAPVASAGVLQPLAVAPVGWYTPHTLLAPMPSVRTA